MTDQVATRTGAEEITWDLSDLYSAVNDLAIDRDFNEAIARAEKLAENYKDRIASLDTEEMRDLLEEYEAINNLAQKIGAYAYLHWSTNTEDAARGALLQKSNERESRLNQKLIFVELEWAHTPEEKAHSLMQNPVLEKYRHWLEVARLYQPYLLSEPEEKILSEKSVTGRNAWMRFLDETLGAKRYDLRSEMAAQEVVLSKLYEPDRDLRHDASKAMTQGLTDMARITTFVFNSVLADKASDDELRGYPAWISSRNLGNQVDDKSVEALIEAVTSRYDIVERYYNLKRRLLGLDELTEYDRYAPLPSASRTYTWDEAREIVLNAYGAFHPRMSEIASLFFERNWIDAAPTPGKIGGAYSANITPDTHPYILMNFEGKAKHVRTLAHELGHGVHQYLSRERGLLEMHTPLTTAETASVFAEMLIFQDLLSRETDPEIRLSMLTTKLEESFATVFRQIAMNRFEDAIHIARRTEGELTTERFSELWLQTQRDMFRGSVNLTDDYGIWWSYVTHFIHVPGYVYAYSFGELLVLALYARYQEVGSDFADLYLKMLAAGGSDWPNELVKPLGVDLSDPNFWTHGLQILDEMGTEAEVLASQIGK